MYSGKGCGYVEDHAVGLVGYGSAGNKNFWLVRNSWGCALARALPPAPTFWLFAL